MSTNESPSAQPNGPHVPSPGPRLPGPRLPDPRLPDPRLPDPRLPDPRLPDPRLPDPRILAALTGTDAVRDRALALRTRRAVYNAVMDRRTDREQGRRNLFIALLITGALTLALAPALWAGIDDMIGGETLLDLPGMLAALGMTLFAAVAAVLFLVGGDHRAPQAARSQRR